MDPCLGREGVRMLIAPGQYRELKRLEFDKAEMSWNNTSGFACAGTRKKWPEISCRGIVCVASITEKNRYSTCQLFVI